MSLKSIVTSTLAAGLVGAALFASSPAYADPPKDTWEERVRQSNESWEKRVQESNRRWQRRVEESNKRFEERVRQSNARWESLVQESNQRWQEYESRVDSQWRKDFWGDNWERDFDQFDNWFDDFDGDDFKDKFEYVEPKPEPQPSPEPYVIPTPRPKPKPDVRPRPKPKPKPQPDLEPEPEPEPPTLEELASKNLTRKEFKTLRSMVNTVADYKRVLSTRNIIYPNKGTSAYRRDVRKDWGAPLKTHNNATGVCDEFATYFTSFFVGKPGYRVFLVEMDDSKRDFESHAVAVYQGPTGNWGFSSNASVTGERFSTKDAAISASVVHSGYKLGETFYWEKEITKEGNWLHNDHASKRLSPR